MTIEELIDILGGYSKPLVMFFFLLPLTAFAYGKLHRKGEGVLTPHKYVYSVIVYLCCVPGIFAAVLTIYSLFFIQINLLQVNYIIYFVPAISMALTLILMKQHVRLDRIPGFHRLRGLMAVLTATFVFALILLKTRIWLFFGSSMLTFVIMLLVIFLFLKWGANSLFREKK